MALKMVLEYTLYYNINPLSARLFLWRKNGWMNPFCAKMFKLTIMLCHMVTILCLWSNDGWCWMYGLLILCSPYNWHTPIRRHCLRQSISHGYISSRLSKPQLTPSVLRKFLTQYYWGVWESGCAKWHPFPPDPWSMCWSPTPCLPPSLFPLCPPKASNPNTITTHHHKNDVHLNKWQMLTPCTSKSI